MRILVAGELNPDLVMASLSSAAEPGREVVAGQCALRLGSSSAICAAGLAALGDDVAFLGVTGDDLFGRYCVARLAELGVDVSLVSTHPNLRTGVTVSLSGRDRALVTYPGAMEHWRAREATSALLTGYEHLHVASYFLQRELRPELPSLFRRAKALGLTTSFDPGHDPYEEWGREVADAFCDASVLFLNDVELRRITGSGSVLRGLQALATDSTTVVVKLGARGAAALHAGDEAERVPALDVEVRDTTGAGDSFNAGFLHGWLRGCSLTEALRRGVVCGSLSTRSLGGCGSQPSAHELDLHLDQLERASP